MMLEPTQILFNENASIFFRNIGTPLLDIFFRAITEAGSEPAYIFLAFLIFWCLDKKTGIRAMYVILFSAYIAILAKNLFGMPRPPAYLHKVTANEFGFPSGHAQLSAGFWGYLGLKNKKIHIIIAGAIAIFLVSLSRIYLGVHYPGDVVGGIIFGLSVAFVAYSTETGILNIFNKQNSNLKFLIALFLPIILVLIASLQANLPEEQIELGIVMASIGAGYLLEEENIKFHNTKNKKQAVNRAFVGILILGAIYLISFILLLLNPVFLYIRYAALGFSSVFIVPWVFTKIEDRKKKISIRDIKSSNLEGMEILIRKKI